MCSEQKQSTNFKAPVDTNWAIPRLRLRVVSSLSRAAVAQHSWTCRDRVMCHTESWRARALLKQNVCHWITTVLILGNLDHLGHINASLSISAELCHFWSRMRLPLGIPDEWLVSFLFTLRNGFNGKAISLWKIASPCFRIDGRMLEIWCAIEALVLFFPPRAFTLYRVGASLLAGVSLVPGTA